MPSLFDRLRNRLFAGLARRSDLDRLYDQIAGLFQIQSALDGRPILGRLRGWAISPDAMAWILKDLQLRTNPTLIEFGCGQSTVILAAMLKLRTGGRLISIEHDRGYAGGIQQQLAAIGAGECVDFRFCPLVEVSGTVGGVQTRSYALEALDLKGVDLALVDGPPAAYGETTRYTPLRWSLDHLLPGGAAYLDDADRPGERKVIESLKAEFPQIVRLELDSEKGLTKFSR